MRNKLLTILTRNVFSSGPVAAAPDGEVEVFRVVIEAVLLQILTELSSGAKLPTLRAKFLHKTKIERCNKP